MSDVEEAALFPAPITGDVRPSPCCCSGGSANKRRSSPDDDDDQLVKKSKKHLFPCQDISSPASTSSNPPLSPTSTLPPSTSSNPPFSPASASRPPRPPSGLRRTTSDPFPYSELLKKFRDGVKEMSSCLDQSLPSEIASQEEQSQVLSETETETETDAPDAALVPYHQDGEDLEKNNSDESVSVEKIGESLNIQFRCPCGKSYHFMLSQGSCFYKLM